MADIEHKNLTGDQLHEPKGISTASSGQVYVADGIGSGAWSSLSTGAFTVNNILYTSTGSNTWTKPANLLGVEYILIGGGGGASTGGGGTGGDTTFNGVIAGGGERGTTTSGDGGTASGGDLNFDGLDGIKGDVSLADTPAPYAISNYGTGKGAIDATHFAGGSGAACLGWFDEDDLGVTETVSVGTAGSGTKSGAQGVATIKEYIKV